MEKPTWVKTNRIVSHRLIFLPLQSGTPFSFYLLGLSLGPVIAAPVSETFGRKVVYLSALPIFAAFTIGSGFSSGIASLTICRLLAGLFSSPGLSIGTGTIADLWPPKTRGGPTGTFVTMVQMGPALGPLIGGFVTVERGVGSKGTGAILIRQCVLVK